MAELYGSRRGSRTLSHDRDPAVRAGRGGFWRGTRGPAKIHRGNIDFRCTLVCRRWRGIDLLKLFGRARRGGAVSAQIIDGLCVTWRGVLVALGVMSRRFAGEFGACCFRGSESATEQSAGRWERETRGFAR